MTAATVPAHAEAWPPGGLEPVEHCPVCGSGRREVLYRGLRDRVFRCAPGEWTLQRCLTCRSGFLDPRPTKETLPLAYRTYYTHAEGAEEQPSTGSIRRFRRSLLNGFINHQFGASEKPSLSIGRVVLRLMPFLHANIARDWRHLPRQSRTASLLDVGCGTGHFLKLAERAGWEVTGIEPDETACAVAGRLRAKIICGGLPNTGLPSESFDRITASHVLEHVNDPGAALREIRRLLRPGGEAWIAIPNFEAKGHARYRRDWLHLDPPRHLVMFTAESLCHALIQAGFVKPTFLTPGMNASFSFLASESVRLGGDPFAPQPGSILVRAAAFLADCRALTNPKQGEEIVLVASKPLDGCSG